MHISDLLKASPFQLDSTLFTPENRKHHVVASLMLLFSTNDTVCGLKMILRLDDTVGNRF